MSGFSSAQIAISEIGVSYPDDSFGQGTISTGPEKVKGQPWMYILRDILQFDDSIDAAKDRITNANRTCNLILGVGDGEKNEVTGVEFSGYVANFYNDENQLPVNDTWYVILSFNFQPHNCAINYLEFFYIKNICVSCGNESKINIYELFVFRCFIL